MISSLKIQNLILIERAEIAFGPGLNILTGETGAGKSAILAAIRLTSGDRADPQLIRQGSERAIVEATVGNQIVRREISRQGKSRCFIDDEQISVSDLRKWAETRIDQIDQSSSGALSDPQEQRILLDRFAGIAEDFSEEFAKEQAQAIKVDTLLEKAPARERELRFLRADLDALEQINWTPGEETALEEELKRLTHSKDLIEKVGQVTTALEAPTLKRLSATLEQCLRFDSKLKPISDALKSAALELEEVSHDLTSYLARVESDPRRLAIVEERLNAIESLKRRLGATTKEQLLAQIDTWERLGEQTLENQKQLQIIRQRNQEKAEQISEKRKKAAQKFAAQVLEELIPLNLPHAQFQISIQSQPMNSTGIDAITYLFSANPGHAPLPLQECASGGELSRVLLAVKTLLAEKESAGCLVFDEIDSNVGGQTATILGEKLRRLSQKRQVICVTHFVQVARCASRHFLVAKKDALTSIEELMMEKREMEYGRMLGEKMKK